MPLNLDVPRIRELLAREAAEFGPRAPELGPYTRLHLAPTPAPRPAPPARPPHPERPSPPHPDTGAAIHDARLGRFVRACPHRGAVGDCRGTARCKLGLRGTAACGHVSPADCKRLCGASLWAASRGLPAPSI